MPPPLNPEPEPAGPTCVPGSRARAAASAQRARHLETRNGDPHRFQPAPDPGADDAFGSEAVAALGLEYLVQGVRSERTVHGRCLEGQALARGESGVVRAVLQLRHLCSGIAGAVAQSHHGQVSFLVDSIDAGR